MIKRLATSLLLCLICALPAHAWQMETSGRLGDRCFSVAYIQGLGLLAGSYKGDGRIYLMDPATLDWRVWRDLPVSDSHESIAYFMPIDGRAGVNAFTEDGEGAQCWTAWLDQDWQFTRTPAKFPPLAQFALGSPEAAALGIAAASAGQGRGFGSVLTRWDIDFWQPFTAELRYNGQPCLIWTAAKFKGRLLAGASASTRDYLAPGVGILAEWAGGNWHIIPSPEMAGVVRLTQLACDPDALYLSTTRGRIWRTIDLSSFTLYHDSEGRHADAWIFDIYGRRVVADALGRVWDEGRLVIERPATAWMSPATITLPDGRQVLAGVITDNGEEFSRFMRIDPPAVSISNGGTN